jgi:hypothetical protein
MAAGRVTWLVLGDVRHPQAIRCVPLEAAAHQIKRDRLAELRAPGLCASQAICSQQWGPGIYLGPTYLARYSFLRING